MLELLVIGKLNIKYHMIAWIFTNTVAFVVTAQFMIAIRFECLLFKLKITLPQASNVEW